MKRGKNLTFFTMVFFITKHSIPPQCEKSQGGKYTKVTHFPKYNLHAYQTLPLHLHNFCEDSACIHLQKDFTSVISLQLPLVSLKNFTSSGQNQFFKQVKIVACSWSSLLTFSMICTQFPSPFWGFPPKYARLPVPFGLLFRIQNFKLQLGYFQNSANKCANIYNF